MPWKKKIQSKQYFPNVMTDKNEVYSTTANLFSTNIINTLNFIFIICETINNNV